MTVVAMPVARSQSVIQRAYVYAVALVAVHMVTWHDLWHFTVDSAVAGVVAWWSFRMMRADRSALGTAAEETYGVMVLVRASDRAAARARVAQLIGADRDVSLKG